MNKLFVIALSVVLVLSFAVVYLLSPSDSDFRAKYAPENFETVASFDVPLDGSGIVDVVSSPYPFSFKKVRMNIDKLEIRINRDISGNLPEFMQENLKAQVHYVPEAGTRLNLEISFPRPLRYYEGYDFVMVRFFDYYKKLLAEHAEIMICVPMNYEFDDN